MWFALALVLLARLAALSSSNFTNIFSIYTTKVHHLVGLSLYGEKAKFKGG